MNTEIIPAKYCEIISDKIDDTTMFDKRKFRQLLL